MLCIYTICFLISGPENAVSSLSPTVLSAPPLIGLTGIYTGIPRNVLSVHMLIEIGANIGICAVFTGGAVRRVFF